MSPDLGVLDARPLYSTLPPQARTIPRAYMCVCLRLILVCLFRFVRMFLCLFLFMCASDVSMNTPVHVSRACARVRGACSSSSAYSTLRRGQPRRAARRAGRWDA